VAENSNFTGDLPGELASVEGLGSWWLPEPFYSDEEDEYEPFSLTVFAHWIDSGAFKHLTSRTILVSPWGVKWPVLHLVRAHWSDKSYWRGKRLTYPCWHLSPDERAILDTCAATLRREIATSG
jgi:hypothetical protein